MKIAMHLLKNILLLCLCVLITSASMPEAQALPYQVNGKIDLRQTGEDHAVKLLLKGRIFSGYIRICSKDEGFCCGTHVSVNANFLNTGAKEAFWAMHVCLLDKDWNLIAAKQAYQVFGQPPTKGDHADLAMPLPKADLAKITQYQILFYDDYQPIGRQ